MQFENENERLVYELTRLDKPGIPEHAVAALLELHIRKADEGCQMGRGRLTYRTRVLLANKKQQ